MMELKDQGAKQAGKEGSSGFSNQEIYLPGSACPNWLPGLSGTLRSAASSGSDLLQQFPVDRSKSIYGISSMPRALAPQDILPHFLPAAGLFTLHKWKEGVRCKFLQFSLHSNVVESGRVCACDTSHKAILRVISAVIWGVKQMRLKQAWKRLFM